MQAWRARAWSSVFVLSTPSSHRRRLSREASGTSCDRPRAVIGRGDGAEARGTAAGLEDEVYLVRDRQSRGAHAGSQGRPQGNHVFRLARGDQGCHDVCHLHTDTHHWGVLTGRPA